MIKKTLVQFLDNIGFTNIERMKNKIDKYDIISFDIFDTLIKREVTKPTDVFKLIEEKTGIEGFAINRMKGEIEARKKMRSGEVTLKEIYKQMRIDSLYSVSEMMNMECEMEMNICHVNQKLFPFYQYCKGRKRIIITSDMYLPHDVIEELLNRNGIFGYEKIFLSNELNMSKRCGDMYDAIISSIGKKKIVHVGNSFKTDYINAVLKGIGVIKIPTNECMFLKVTKASDL